MVNTTLNSSILYGKNAFYNFSIKKRMLLLRFFPRKELQTIFFCHKKAPLNGLDRVGTAVQRDIRLTPAQGFSHIQELFTTKTESGSHQPVTRYHFFLHFSLLLASPITSIKAPDKIAKCKS